MLRFVLLIFFLVYISITSLGMEEFAFFHRYELSNFSIVRHVLNCSWNIGMHVFKDNQILFKYYWVWPDAKPSVKWGFPWLCLLASLSRLQRTDGLSAIRQQNIEKAVNSTSASKRTVNIPCEWSFRKAKEPGNKVCNDTFHKAILWGVLQ